MEISLRNIAFPFLMIAKDWKKKKTENPFIFTFDFRSSKNKFGMEKAQSINLKKSLFIHV